MKEHAAAGSTDRGQALHRFVAATASPRARLAMLILAGVRPLIRGLFPLPEPMVSRVLSNPDPGAR
jgi:hypothetical protein